MSQANLPLGVILAGGSSSRMGNKDKAFALLCGRPLVAHVARALQPQVCGLVVVTDRQADDFAAFNLPVTTDPWPERRGPLAGLLAGMFWSRQNPIQSTDVLLAATDMPFLPADLVPRLSEQQQPGGISIARSAGRLHPVCGIFPVSLTDDLKRFLEVSADWSMRAWLRRHAVAEVDFALAANGCDPFLNVNGPDDLARAAQFPT